MSLIKFNEFFNNVLTHVLLDVSIDKEFIKFLVISTFVMTDTLNERV